MAGAIPPPPITPDTFPEWKNITETRHERVSWDFIAKADLRLAKGVSFDFYCADLTPFASFSFYFHRVCYSLAPGVDALLGLHATAGVAADGGAFAGFARTAQGLPLQPAFAPQASWRTTLTKTPAGKDARVLAVWRDHGWLDFVCPMDYIDSNALFRGTVAAQITYAGKVPLYPGIGLSCWKDSHDAAKLAQQISILRELNVPGFTVFNFDSNALSALPLLRMGITADR